MQKTIIFLNHEIDGLFVFLRDKKITSGKQSRMRTRFCDILEKRLLEIERSRSEIMKRCCETNENGDLKLIQNEGSETYYYKILPNSEDYLRQEISILLHEQLIIEVTESAKEMIQVVKEIVLESEFEDGLYGDFAKNYDKWCEIFEWYNE